MATDDKKIIFSMVGVGKLIPPSRRILKDIYLSFYYGAKIGIIGLNGSGKSSLLKIIAGLDKSHEGEVHFSPGYSVGYLEQEPRLDDNKTVKEVVMEGVKEVADLIDEYNKLNEKFCEPMSDDEMAALIEKQGELTELMEQHDAWNLDSKLERAMDALNCPEDDALVKNLSGGERRRVALCRILLPVSYTHLTLPNIATRTRHLAFGRADQPFGCREHRMVGAAFAAIQRYRYSRNPRSLLP